MARRHGAGALAAIVAVSAFPFLDGVPAGRAVLKAANSDDPVLLAAGDIARCASSGDEQTAEILDAEPGTVAALGDLAYEAGSEQEFADCYGPSWGRHRERTFPIPGNHEYMTPDAAPYYAYFGARAGPAGLGYYSYDLGAWHVVALNSNCDDVPGGCAAGSPQEAWLRADLAASTAQCTLAYWHQPSFSSGVEHGPSTRMRALLDVLQGAHADVLLSGSEHHYERFAPQTPDRDPSPAGIRAFVVGTGGALGSYPFTDPPAPNSEVRAEGTRGVLKLTLRPDRYEWQYIAVAGETFTDAGSTACHDAPAPDSTAPTAPSGLSGSSSSSRRVDLTWTASTDDTAVAGYRIFRNGAQVGSTSATTWTDTGLTASTSYAYHVVAYDVALNVSPTSNTVDVTTRSADRVLTIDVAADTTIEAATPLRNYGADATIRTDGSPLKAFLLKFDVAGVGPDTVTAAKLRLHVVDSSNRGGDFRTTASTWSENAVTWQTAPSGGTLAGSFGGVSRGTWHELSLAAGVVSRDGVVAFRIDSSSSDGADYASREGTGGLAAQLVLSVTEASAPDIQPPPPDATAPSAPGSLSATAVSGTWVDLAWSASTDDIGVAGYRVLRDGVPVGTTTATAWADTGVSPAATYSYEVVAYDAALNASAPSTAAQVATPPTGTDATLPVRAAFYYPWFPEAWTQSSTFPYTRYTPSLGWYDSGSSTVIASHVGALEYGHFDAAIASWWGRGTRTDNRLDDLLAGTRAAGSSLKWAVYEEAEGAGNPTVDELRAELTYLRDRYATHPNFLRVGGRFVVFVYNVGDGCEVVDRWGAANTVGAYVVLKVFSGHRECPSQPDAWHQYEPGHDVSPQGTDSFSISPGFHNMSEPAPRLVRDLDRWRQNIREMLGSGTRWQLVTTFNEWGEGSAVESAQEWASASGYGSYLDALHENGVPPPAPPLPPAERTLVFSPSDDASITSGSPTRNFGTATTLEVDGSPVKASLLKFAVTGVGGDTVTAAKLRVRVTNGSDRGGDFALTGTGWTERTVTWASAPPAAAPVGSLGRVFAGTWYELPLPAGAVNGDGSVGFRASSPSADGATYVSKEGTGGLAAELVLTVSAPAVPDTQPPTTPAGLNATARAGGGVDVVWTGSTDDVRVAGYRIFRDGAELATTSETSYTDTTTAPATSYGYRVAAYDSSGNVSPPSDAVTVTTASAPRTLTFTPIADAYIERDAPTTNRGSALTLQVDNSPVKASLLTFDVAGVGTGSVTAAKIRLHVTNGSNLGGDFGSTSAAWAESTVTWANAPAAATRVGSLGAVALGNWQELTLAAGAVTADGKVSFRVDSTSADGAAYDSKEAGTTLAPQLILTVADWPSLAWVSLR